MKISSIVGIWLLCMAPSLYSQSQFSFSGRVLDANTYESISGAHIECHETGYTTLTDTTGAFEIPNLKKGQYHLHIEMAGYKAYAEHFDIDENDVSNTLILLTSSHIELQQVNIESEVSKADYKHSTQDLMILDLKSASSVGATNLSQKLAQLPGVNKLESGTGIAKPIIRGLSGNRILVSDLGMKQEGQQWGSDHGLEIDPFTNEKVEVIKGPASILYGSDALGGVIRIQTPSIPARGWSGGVTGLYRSNNEYYGSSVNVNYAANHFFIKSRVSWSEYGDMQLPAKSFTYLNRTLPIYNNELKNTAGRDFHYQVTAGWKGVKNVHKLTFSHFHQNNGFFPGLVGIPSGFNVLPDGNTRNVDLPNQQVDHIKAALNSTLVLKKGWLQLDAGWQRNIREERIIPHQQGYAPISDSPVAHHLELSTSQLSLRWHLPSLHDWRWIPGASISYQENRRGGWEYLLPNDRSVSAGAFIYSEKSIEEHHLVFNGGLRFDVATISSAFYSTPIYNSDAVVTGYLTRVEDNDLNFANWSASSGLSWSPREKWNIKMNLARSFRVPNQAELFINGVHHGTFRHEMGDASLKSEIGYQADVTVLYELKQFYVKVSPYINYFNGFIYLRPTAQFSTLPDGGQVYQYSQHDALFAGSEFYIEWHPVKQIHMEYMIDGVYSYNLNTGLALPFTPPVRGRFQLEYEKDFDRKFLSEIAVGGNYLVWSSQNRVDRNEYATSGAYTVDLFLKLEFKEDGASLNIQANNIFNRYYLNHLSAYRALNIPQPGRNFTLMLNLPFGKK